MAYNIIVENKDGESAGSLYKRFSKLMKESNISKTLKKNRFFIKKASQFTKKEDFLKNRKKRIAYNKLHRDGKLMKK